jgi:hypothetical protein
MIAKTAFGGWRTRFADDETGWNGLCCLSFRPGKFSRF